MALDKGEHAHGTFPEYALWRKERVRILWYEKDASLPFHILCKGDVRRNVTREELTFLKPKKR